MSQPSDDTPTPGSREASDTAGLNMPEPNTPEPETSNAAAAPSMQAAREGASHSGRVMQEQPAVRPVPRSHAEAMQPEVPGQVPTGIEGDEAEREIRRKSRRSFLWAGIGLATGFAGWRVFTHNPEQDGLLSPLRHTLQFNERLSQSFFSPSRLVATYPVSRAESMKVNGTYGVEDDLDRDAWRLRVEGAQGQAAPLLLTLDDIRALPRVEMVVEHKCVEGWSAVIHWAGARFSDFAAKYMPPGRDGHTPDLQKPGSLARYVSMTTPDSNYYVGLDMASALHPQTLLAYEMNGQPLSDEHGAPLRLAMPIKYGIKSIKRIGTIAYTDTLPADYWAERGYDWYSGH